MKLRINADATQMLSKIAAVAVGTSAVLHIANAQTDLPRPVSNFQYEVPRFQLVARAKSSMIEAGQPVIVELELKSDIESDGFISDSVPVLDFRVEAKTEDGKTVNSTAYISEVLQRPLTNRKFLKMQQGQTLQRAMLLNRVVDLSVSGTYTIIFKKGVPKSNFKEISERRAGLVGNTNVVDLKESWFDMITSNPITITIVEPEPKTVTALPTLQKDDEAR